MSQRTFRVRPYRTADADEYIHRRSRSVVERAVLREPRCMFCSVSNETCLIVLRSFCVVPSSSADR